MKKTHRKILRKLPSHSFHLRTILGDISSSLIAGPNSNQTLTLFSIKEEEKERKEDNCVVVADDDDGKENLDSPSRKSPTFIRPSLSSETFFDPKLLSAFHDAVREYQQTYSINSRSGETNVDGEDPFSEFEYRCPPGGSSSIILYTTSLRGIRKTFEDCNRTKFLLGTLQVVFYERDLSMHSGFRDELLEVMSDKRVIPPRLFVKGRYIGGADEVVRLHEMGKLVPMLEGLPVAGLVRPCCVACGGLHFLPCFDCNGSRKRRREETDEEERCGRCNENGLVVCSLCLCRC